MSQPVPRFRLFALLGLAALATTTLPARAGDGMPPFDFDAIKQRIQREDLSDAEVRQLIQLAEDIKELSKKDMSLSARARRALLNPWVLFGMTAQAIFMMRFVLQLIASERRGRSYVPVAFWYCSLAGGLMLLAYALQKRDPVFVLGQGLGIAIYARNLYLIHSRPKRVRARREDRNRQDSGSS